MAKPERERTAEARALLGEVCYLDGGLFLQHRIELENPAIAIPDRAFEDLLGLFDRYSWSLDDTPGGKDDEINPDVLGYIFEKYINQKAFGAYYTRPEITDYLCEQTLYRLILDGVNAPELPGVRPARSFESLEELLLRLDGPLCRQLLLEVLPKLTILDPACGSGAFLVAALKALTNVYSAVIGRIEFVHDSSVREWLRKANAEHPSAPLLHQEERHHPQPLRRRHHGRGHRDHQAPPLPRPRRLRAHAPTSWSRCPTSTSTSSPATR